MKDVSGYTVKEITKKLQLSWSDKKLRDFLKSKKDIETLNKKPQKFTLKSIIQQQKSLFDQN
jgi:hypothetical protein